MTQELKHSKQRDALLALLKSVTCHPSAEWLYTELKRDCPKLSLATVYRNLTTLCENGMAIRLDVGDGTVRYDAQTRDHNHFFCNACKRLSDVGCDDEISGLDRLIEQRSGVKITSHSFVFYGLCRECNIKQQKHEN